MDRAPTRGGARGGRLPERLEVPAGIVVAGGQRRDLRHHRRQGERGPIGPQGAHRRRQRMAVDRRLDPAGRRLDDLAPGGSLLVGIPRRRVECVPVRQPGVHRPEHLGRFCDRGEPLVRRHPCLRWQVGPAPVDEHEAGAPIPERMRGPGRDHRAEPVASHDERARAQRAIGTRIVRERQQPGALGHRDRVLRKVLAVIAVGRRVRQAVAAQVHGDDAGKRPNPARDRRPGPGGLGQPVDQQDPGHAAVLAARRDVPAGVRDGTNACLAGGAGRRAAPVQEVDAHRAVHRDHESGGLGDLIGERRRERVDAQGPQPGARERQAVHAVHRAVG